MISGLFCFLEARFFYFSKSKNLHKNLHGDLKTYIKTYTKNIYSGRKKPPGGGER